MASTEGQHRHTKDIVVDFAEFFTGYARRVVPAARRKRLLFLFDYRGPFVDVDADELAMRHALQRLSSAALDLLEDGFIFLTAQADWSDSGLADLAISIAGNGQRAGESQLDEAVQRLRLAERERDLGMPEGTRVASGICPHTGATISFAANRSDGILLALDLTAPASLLDAEPAPNADGARAWLVSDTPGLCQSLVRRLQRLGWATSAFGSVAQAMEQLQQMKPGMARPSLVIGVDSPAVTRHGLKPLREALPAHTQVVFTAREDVDDTRRDGIACHAWPISPAELIALTRLTRVAAEPWSGETMPAPLYFRDRPHALVVDDNAVNLLVAGGLLQVAGFEVQTATSGEDAIRRCRKLAPQLVLMDVHMPGMDGLQTTRTLRQLQREGLLPHFAIVAATADAMAISERACRDAGMDGYLSKPLSLQAIELEVDRLLPGLRRSMAPH